MTPAVSALHPSPVILQEHLLGMSPVWKVRGRCPEDVVIGLDLRRNEDSVGGRWKKCLVRENSVAGGHVDHASGAVEGLTRDQEDQLVRTKPQRTVNKPESNPFLFLGFLFLVRILFVS